MMNRMLAVLAAALMILGAGRGAAEEVILVDQANPPFAYALGEQAAGLYPALLREVFRRIGRTVRIETAPLKRVLLGIDSGEAGAGGLYKSGEGFGKYDYGQPLFEEVLLLYVRRGESFLYVNLNSLSGKTIGVVRHRSYGEVFDHERKLNSLKVEDDDTDLINFLKLADRRLDAVIATREAGALALSAGNLIGTIEPLPIPFATIPAQVAFAKASNQRDLLSSINRALSTMKTDGSYDRMIATLSPR